MPPTIKSALAATKYRVVPRNSEFGFFRNSMARLDAEGLELPLAQHPLEQELADEIGCEDVRDQAHHQRHGEALDRARAELEQERGRDQGRCVGVEDGDPDALEAVVDGD